MALKDAQMVTCRVVGPYCSTRPQPSTKTDGESDSGQYTWRSHAQEATNARKKPVLMFSAAAYLAS